MAWVCRKCGKEIIEEIKLVEHYKIDKNLALTEKVGSGGYGTRSFCKNKLYKCTYCGAEQFNNIDKLAKWED